MNQIEAGIEQFEWAIKLYLNENAYVPAITLAGASEGIFGELIQGSAIKELRQRLLQNTGLEDISKQLNKPKNWLKHGSCKENYSSIDDDELQAMAISRILVSAISLIHLKPDYMSNLFIEFMKQVQSNHPDFLPKDGINWNSINYLEEKI